MLCKKCGEIFSDGFTHCPKCGERKAVKKPSKTFKVDLPTNIKPQTATDTYISSNSKLAPNIEKVIVEHEQNIKNKTRNTRYIDNEDEEILQPSSVSKPQTLKNATPQPLAASPKKPSSSAELFERMPVKKVDIKPKFKIDLPQEYADLELKSTNINSQPTASAALKQQPSEQVKKVESSVVAKAIEKAQNTQEIKSTQNSTSIKQVNKEKEFEVALQNKKAEAKKSKIKIKPKKAMTAIVAMMMILVVFIGSLTAVAINTTWFVASEEIVRSISFISVKDEEIEEIETFLNQIATILVLDTYESTDMSASEVLDLVAPYSDYGLYALFFGSAELVYDNNDPAGRFAQEGDAYYCIAQEEIDEILAVLGVSSISMAINEDYYLYDGYYYFAQHVDDIEHNEYLLTLSSVKNTSDDCYYVELKINDLTDLVTYKRYILIESEEIDEEQNYTLALVSDVDLFNSFGEMRVSETDDSELYSINREVIELETSDGVLIYEYIIDYPVFTGDSNTVLMINQIYSDLISAYKLSTEEVDNEYAIYQNAEIDEDTFPMRVYIDITVELYDDDYLVLLQQVIEENSLIQDQEDVLEDVIIPIYDNSISSYNFKIDTSTDMKLSEILGDDNDEEFCEILYRIYSGYDYSTVLTGEYLLSPSYYYYGWEDDYDSTPDDTLGIGDDIYDSCFTLTDDGIVFYYANEYGYYEEILLENSVIDSILDIVEAVQE